MMNKADIVIDYKNSCDYIDAEHFVSMNPDFFTRFEIVSRSDIKMSGFRNRLITKFLIPETRIKGILNECSGNYKILEHNGAIQTSLFLEYFDTPELRFYNDHVNGKLNRTKVRIKQSSISDTRFREIWRRKSNGRMVRKRMIIDDTNSESENIIEALISKYAGISKSELIPSLHVCFNRITLLDTLTGERVNIDSSLVFSSPVNPGIKYEPVGLAIIEIRKKRKARSFIADLLEDNQIRKTPISKYCLGISFINPKAKVNNYKPVIRKIEKTLSYGIAE